MRLRLTATITAVTLLVSLALLDAEVTVTRLLGYRLFYHFVFFVISLAQLGMAGAGAWVYATRKAGYGPEDLAMWLTRVGLFILATLVVYAYLSPAPNVLLKVAGPPAVAYLLAVALPLVALYFSGGMVLTILFTELRADIARLYAADLVGASVGCVVSVLAMAWFGPIRAFLGAGVLVVACALALARGTSQAPRWLLLVVLLGGMAAPDVFDPMQALGLKSLFVRSRWDHLGRVDAVGPSRYLMDGVDGSELKMSRLADGLRPADLPDYFLVGEAPRVAIIGVGAGPQLAEAVAAGARQVVAVDLNATVVDWGKHEDAVANQGIFLRPEVEAFADEGRHFIQSSADPFDLVVMFGVVAHSAAAQGANALAEAFLFTVESFQAIHRKLSPRGLMCISRWYFQPPRETMRIFTTVLEALRREGVAEPRRHLLVLVPVADVANAGKQTGVFVLFTREPLAAARLDELDALLRRIGWSYLYRPGAVLDTPFHEYVASPDRAAFLDAYPYLVGPTTDSAPFFFQISAPWRTGPATGGARPEVPEGTREAPRILLATLLTALVLSAAMLGVPLYLRRRDLAGSRGLGTAWFYFSCLGLGFMALEIPVIQTMSLFLGHPTYAISVVLLGLLASAGIGSALAPRLSRRGVQLVLAGIVVLALSSSRWLLAGVSGLLHLGLPARLALALAYLAAIGVPMGMPFVAGIREVEAEGPAKVAWAWASNGAASVVGSCGLMILLVLAGSAAGMGLAALAYLGAALSFGHLAARDAT